MLNSVLPTQKGEQKAVNKDRQVRSLQDGIGTRPPEMAERLTPTKTDDGRTDSTLFLHFAVGVSFCLRFFDHVLFIKKFSSYVGYQTLL